MSAFAGTHPSWCDKTNCAVDEHRPYGFHQSASEVVPADPPGCVVAELLPYPLTPRQARQLQAALDKLLGASGF